MDGDHRQPKELAAGLPDSLSQVHQNRQSAYIDWLWWPARRKSKKENMVDLRILISSTLILGANTLAPQAHAKPSPKTKPASRPATPVKPVTSAKPASSASPRRVPPTVWRESGAPVMGLSVSASRVLVTEGSDTVWLYTPEGKLQKSFVPKDADDFRVFSYDAAISSDGKYGLVAAVDLSTRLLDLEAEKVATPVSARGARLNGVAFAPDGKTVALATAGGVIVSEVPSRVERPGFAGMGGGAGTGAGSVAFSPDGTWLAVGGEDKTVRLFKTADGSEATVWREHEGAVRALAWSPDGKSLASGSRDGGVQVWDVAAGKRLAAIAPGEGAVESLAWSVGGAVLAVAVSPSGGESSARPSEPERNPPAPAAAPRRVVQVWTVKGQSPTLKRAVLDVFGARRIAFAPDGKLIAGFANGRLAAYDLAAIPPVAAPASLPASGTAERGQAPSRPQAPAKAPVVSVREDAQGFRALTGMAGGAEVVSFSPNGTLLAAGNAEAQVGLWDARSGAFVRLIGGHTRGLNSLAWSPDGTLLASGGEDRLQVTRVADGKTLWSVEGRAVIAGWSPDGRSVFAFVGVYKPGVPQTLRAWGGIDGSQGAALGSLPYPGHAAISPDGTLIAADQGTSNGYLDTTILSIFAASPVGSPAGNTPGNIVHSIGSIHGRVNALRWLGASRLVVDEGDYRDGHDDSQKPVPGKLGVRVFNVAGKSEEKPLLTFAMPIVALDENTRGELAVAEDRAAVRVFNTQGQEVASWPLPGRNVRVKSLAWAPGGEVLAIGIEGSPLRLWRVARAAKSR